MRSVLVVLWCCLPIASGPSVVAEEAAADASPEVRAFLGHYCSRCHGGKRPKAAIELRSFVESEGALDFPRERKIWEKVIRVLRQREMPPEGKRQPSEDERSKIAEAIRAGLDTFDCDEVVDPGRVTLKRLNRVEYDNTIRDLLGLDLKLARDFPADEVGHGFDNIGDVLSLPPLLLEKYLDASEKAADAAFPPAKLAAVKQRKIDKTQHTRGDVPVEFELDEGIVYLLRVRASGEQAGPDPVRMSVLTKKKSLATFDVLATGEKGEFYDLLVRLPKGQDPKKKSRFAIRFENDYYDPKSKDPKLRGDRNLRLFAVTLQPLIAEASLARFDAWLGKGAAKKLSAGHKEYVRHWVGEFASRAFRRPATPSERKRLVQLVTSVVDDGESLSEGLRLAMTATLSSPHFVFHFERGFEKTKKTSKDGELKIEAIDDYALAARLSYFLWSSLPDARLRSLAAEGKLSDPKVLREEAKRMLASERSRAFVDNFAGQWLQTRFLRSVQPDPKTYPGFDDALRDAMEKETLLFFDAILRENRSVREILNGDFTYVNERLARHYGMKDIKGPAFRRVSLAESPRGGLLTQASFLTITSNPTRTSPVKRGLWVLDRLLSSPPPPPPPDVEELSEEPEAILSGSLRQRMEKHREDPSCASCHARMDPI
ncbi:MAG: DUF1592 domain-containing protein, partial [Planctomycetota bacterium]